MEGISPLADHGAFGGGEPGGAAAKALIVELIEGQVVACGLTQERTRSRRVGWC